MPKQCPRCGYVNVDTANYCLNCGYQLLSSYPLSAPPPSQPSRTTLAFDIFTRNLSIIVPAVIMLIIEIVLVAILGAITAGVGLISPIAFTVVGLISSIILSIISSILFIGTVHTTVYMAQDAIRNVQPNLNASFYSARSSLSRLSVIAVILVVLGILLGISRSLTLTWIIVGLVGVLLYIISASIVLNRTMTITEAINWYSRAFNQDAISSLIILIGSIISLIPVLNLFAIPYTSILTYLMVRDIS
ncbi:zinc ribbon domain-containing protein [Sulfolobus tengchongensis]|uniref:Zinc ribbon domain-containing protein n=1 Tax=Sulfolobus tengchongensis TaxID=207809 RepID=A0AAX4L5Z8_9CREN